MHDWFSGARLPPSHPRELCWASRRVRRSWVVFHGYLHRVAVQRTMGAGSPASSPSSDWSVVLKALVALSPAGAIPPR